MVEAIFANDNLPPREVTVSETIVADENQSDTQDQGGDYSPAQIKLAKDSFYAVLCGCAGYGNKAFINRAGLPGGPLKSLDLKGYGPVGRGASDTIFDRLSEYPFLARWLVKLGPTEEFMTRWGGLVMLLVAMKEEVPKEIAERQNMLKSNNQKKEEKAG